MESEFPEESQENGEKDEPSFADLFESYSAVRKEDLQVGDKLEGAIVSIGMDSVFIDAGTKIDGVVEKEELLDDDGELPYAVGDSVTLYVVALNENEIRLSKAISGIGGQNQLREAFENHLPVEGRVKAPCKGGFQVEMMQRTAFCPISQMDVKYVQNPEDYVGEKHPFLIIQFEGNGRNIVVSRRKLLQVELEEAKKELLERLAPGTRIEGTATRLMPYGAFVELIPGLEGMVHISELSWSRLEKPDEVLHTGDPVTAKVLSIEKDPKSGQTKISLSVKQMTADPWESAAEHFSAGDKLKGTVTRCTNFGAFVEIAPGIEGLVHISEMSYTRRVNKPEEIVKLRETVSVVIKEVDVAKRRISLSIKDAEGDPWLEVPEKYTAGSAVTGTLERKEKFGYFIALEPGVTGLMPRSKLAQSEQASALEKLKPGAQLSVRIEFVNAVERKLTLVPADAGDEGDWRRFSGENDMVLGSLGEQLQKVLGAKNDP